MFYTMLSFPKAAYFDMLTRGHWSIENQMHWNLDVSFLEDACRARRGFAVVNLSTIGKLAMQIIKEHIDESSLKNVALKHAYPTTTLEICYLGLNFDSVALIRGG